MLINYTPFLVHLALFSLKSLAIVAHHVRIELSLIPVLHYGDVLMKPFAVFITNVPKDTWEKFNMRGEEMQFPGHPCSPVAPPWCSS